ncbi:MAG TPA: hypothetical protein VGG14_04590 [Candidatus Sulfotelmatobacter sp.]|jgi:hypothetical protein
MTVCIAAITLGNEIVTVSDTMIHGLMSSADANTVKMSALAKDWNVMWAADDITQCIPIVQRAEQYFTNRDNTLRVARSCLKRAYQQHLTEMRADQVLGAFGMDMRTFLDTKATRFSEKESEALMSRMDQIRGDWEFLAFGFDARKEPHLFTVSEPGADCTYDVPGFCSVGSGKYAADSLLFQLEQSRACTLEKTLVSLLFAKFMAEKAGAGRHTFICAGNHGSTLCHMSPELEPTARRIWEDRVSPKVTDQIVDEICRQPIRLT